MSKYTRRDLLFKALPFSGSVLLAASQLGLRALIPKTPEQTPKSVSETVVQSNLLSDYTFSNFVVGPNNEFAHIAAYIAAEIPERVANPLFLYGPTGMGKTHLLNAIGNHIKANNPSVRVIRITGENFLNDCIHSIRRGQMEQFKARFRKNCDVLLIDDIHILSRGQSVQEEFFYTLNTFMESGRQIVVTSDRLPKDIEGLSDRVQSRLESGLIVDIERADLPTRIAILNHKAKSSGVSLPDDVTQFIAKNSRRSIRELEGNLARLRINSELLSSKIDLNLAKTLLRSKV